MAQVSNLFWKKSTTVFSCGSGRPVLPALFCWFPPWNLPLCSGTSQGGGQLTARVGTYGPSGIRWLSWAMWSSRAVALDVSGREARWRWTGGCVLRETRVLETEVLNQLWIVAWKWKKWENGLQAFPLYCYLRATIIYRLIIILNYLYSLLFVYALFFLNIPWSICQVSPSPEWEHAPHSSSRPGRQETPTTRLLGTWGNNGGKSTIFLMTLASRFGPWKYMKTEKHVI